MPAVCACMRSERMQYSPLSLAFIAAAYSLSPFAVKRKSALVKFFLTASEKWPSCTFVGPSPNVFHTCVS